MRVALVLVLFALGGCQRAGWITMDVDAGADEPEPPPGTPPATDAGITGEPVAPTGDLDREGARARYVSTTDLVRRIFAPGCAAQQNECHHSEDFPDLHSEGNLHNLLDTACNQGIGERLEVEDFCERRGDEIVIFDGPNEGFAATIGSIITHAGDDGAFEGYEVRIDTPIPTSQSGASFRIARDGVVIRGLGGGASAELEEGTSSVFVTDPADLLNPGAVRQGDENQNGSYGDGSGALIEPGNARASYLVLRLFGLDTNRVRMPLGLAADNPTEVNPPLTREQMWVLTSWINCMDPSEGPYADIGYDCAANADNDGTWR